MHERLGQGHHFCRKVDLLIDPFKQVFKNSESSTLIFRIPNKCTGKLCISCKVMFLIFQS